MSTVSALQSRLKELSTALAQIHPLVSRLHNFTTAVGQGDEARIELGGEIHSRLKDAEDELELLKDDVDSLETSTDSRRKGYDSDKETEKERVIALARRLADDLKRYKRSEMPNLLGAKSESYFSPERRVLSDETRRKRKQSSAALSSLSESYTSLDTLLSSSRNLVGSLLRSQKSDTWYLETAFYILIGTISWLVFRRLLYGPLWWLVWIPLKLVLQSVFGVVGAVGLTSTAVQSSAIATSEILAQETPALHHVPEVKAHGVGADAIPDHVPGTDSVDRDWIIDKIGEIVEDNVHEIGTILDDISLEELQGREEIPSNTKKRINKARAAAAATGGSKQKPTEGKEEQSRLQPWVEKYRPKTLDDVAAQDHTTKVLQRTLQASNLPHMLFYGPPGTGKTSTILALAKSLFGPALYRSRILELNASDERGIGIVREKVKGFARVQLSHPTGLDAEYFEKYPCPPFKIIILDEADSMTQDAQSALRRTMEQYSRITRFCLVCNYVTRIIEPLASRCSKFRFKPLDNSAAGDRLARIAQTEGLSLEDGVVDKLIACSDGDLRRAITYMQSAARLVGAAQSERKGEDEDEEMKDQGSETITVRTIEEIAGVIPESILDKLVQSLQPKKIGTPYEAISKVVKDVVADGWSATQLLIQLYRRVIYNDAIPDFHKNKIVLVFSEMDKRLVDGADEHLSILDVALQISGILGES
ncbi:P-loop containing nucleoside triphosphate hydrolase protein [Aspergillus crustosus]